MKARRQLRARADSDSGDEAKASIPAVRAASAVLKQAGSNATAAPKMVGHLFDGDEQEDGGMVATKLQQPGLATSKRLRADGGQATSSVSRKLPRSDVSMGHSSREEDKESNEVQTSEYSAERLAQLRASQAYKLTTTVERERDAEAARAAVLVAAEAAASSLAKTLTARPAHSGATEVDSDTEMARRAALAKAHRESMRSGGGPQSAAARRYAFVTPNTSGAGPDDDSDEENGSGAFPGGRASSKAAPALANGDENGFIPLNGKRTAPAAKSVPASLRALATTDLAVPLATSSSAASSALSLRAAAAGVELGPGDGSDEGRLTSWEKAQLKRAAPAAASGSSGSRSEDPAQAFMQQEQNATSGQVLALPDPSASIDTIIGSFAQAVSASRATAETEAREAARVRAEAAEITASLPALHAALTSASASFDLFQGLRLYLGHLVPCMRAKAGQADEWEAAEAAHVDAAAHAARAARRRALHSAVRSAQAQGAMMLSVGGTLPPAPHGASGTDAAEIDLDDTGEGGMSPALHTVVTALAAGSEALGPAHLRLLEQAPAADSDSDAVASASRLRAAARLLLGDVHEAYATAGAALARLGGWRGHAHPGLARSYVDAYAYLSIPGLLAPLVRSQLASQWVPMRLPGEGANGGGGGDAAEPALDPSKLEWVSAALEFTDGTRDALERLGQPPADGANAGKSAKQASAVPAPVDAAALSEAIAADEALLPQLVGAAALPRVARLLSHSGGLFDPAGSEASNAAAGAAVREMLLYEPSQEALQTLLGAVAGALQEAVSDACVPLLAAGPHSLHASSLYSWLDCLRLLQSLCGWADVLSPALLRRMGMGQLLGPVMLPLLQWAATAAAASAQGHVAAATTGGVVSLSSLQWLHVAGGLTAAVVATLPPEWWREGEGALAHDAGDPRSSDAARSLAKLVAHLTAKAGPGPAPAWLGHLATG